MSHQLIHNTKVTEKLITTEELDFWSTLDSETGGPLEKSETLNGMTSDRVEDRYANLQLNTGAKGTEELQRIFEGDLRHRNVWMVERDSRRLVVSIGSDVLNVLIRGADLENNVIRFLWRLQARSRSEEVDSMSIVWFPPVDSTSDIVYNRRGSLSQ